MMTDMRGSSATNNSGSQPGKSPRACDRCHQIKERCQWSLASKSCIRCQRLGFTCFSNRPLRPVGRRPRRFQPLKHGDDATSSRQNSRENNVIDAHDIVVSHFPLSEDPSTSMEYELIHYLLDSSQVEKLGSYVLTPRFQDEERRWLVDSLRTSYPILKDVYVACAGSLLQAFEGQGTNAAKLQEVCLRRASAAVTTLRSISVTNIDDAIMCLNLGIGLATFGYSALGANVSGICRYCLNLIKPRIEIEPLPDAETQSLLHCLAFFETMDCLATRELPTIKVTLPFPRMVDRYIGLSYPLLPIFYDICYLSHALGDCPPVQQPEILRRLDSVENTVIEWVPHAPADFIRTFGPTEIIHILAQARVYRLLGLLLIHRLRYPFGQKDREAQLWSQDIINELELANQLCKNRPVHCVTMPFLAAAVEITESYHTS